MNVSTSINVLFGHGTVSEQMKRVYDAGFRFMDINFCDWVESEENGTCFPSTEAQWDAWVQEIKTCAKQYGITLNQAHGPLFNIFEEGVRGEHLRVMCEKSIRAAHELGIPWVVFHAGTRDGDFSSKEHIAALKAENHAFFDPLVKVAEELHVGIAIENMSNHFEDSDEMYCGTLDELLDLVDSFESEYVGICWDEIVGGLRDISYQGDLTFEAHMLIRPVPDACKDTALRLLYEIGESLAGKIG